MAKLEDSSGGNPMFALHIGRALLERGSDAGDSELPIPESLLQLVGERLDGLGTAIAAVQVAAVLSRPCVSLITELLGTAGYEALRMASEAGVLAIDGDRVSFTHPLLATAAYSQLDRDGRRELHATVAALVDDVEDHARHLALAAEQPDADVADALDLAARRARARCAPDAAAELWEAAARLTSGRQTPTRHAAPLRSGALPVRAGGRGASASRCSTRSSPMPQWVRPDRRC